MAPAAPADPTSPAQFLVEPEPCSLQCPCPVCAGLGSAVGWTLANGGALDMVHLQTCSSSPRPSSVFTRSLPYIPPFPEALNIVDTDGLLVVCVRWQ